MIGLIIGVDIGLGGGIAWMFREGGRWITSAVVMPVQHTLVTGKKRTVYDRKELISLFDQLFMKIPSVEKDGLCLAVIEKGEVFATFDKNVKEGDEPRTAGTLSAYRIGYGEGLLTGILGTYVGVEIKVIRAMQWRPVVFAPAKPPRGDKSANIDLARRLFPAVGLIATSRSRMPHTGIVDALLIAEYGRRTCDD